MGKKLYVGNLTYGVTDSTLEQISVGRVPTGEGDATRRGREKVRPAWAERASHSWRVANVKSRFRSTNCSHPT